MLNLAQELKKNIETAIAAAQESGKLPETKKLPPVVVKAAQEEGHGDYASPFALALTKLVKKPPMQIVEIVAEHMEKPEYLGKLEAAAPGFLNMWIAPGWMTARLDDVIQHDVTADISIGNGKSVNFEFISANPTGPLTLGNARTAFSADTLANVLIAAGYNVTREYYVNDAGNQVKKLGESVLRRALQASGEHVDFSEELYQGDYISDLAQEISEQLKENEGKEFTKEDLEDAAVLSKVSQAALVMMLTHIKETISKDLKITFDVWTSEKALRDSGLIEKTLDVVRKRGYAYKKEGAEWLKTTVFGDEKDRVFVKKDGEYAYIAPDIAYHHQKFERKFDLIFTFLGADHLGHVPKLKAAMQVLGHDVEKLHFPIAQWFTLVRGGKAVAMSKRKGQIYTPKELIEEVGYDPARYFFVQHRLDTHMDFDLDLAKEKSDRNPVYYVQYAYVRLQSILRRAKEEGVISEVGMQFDMSSSPALTQTPEIDLMKKMYVFPEMIAEIAQTYGVHQLPYYAYELAKAVHVFYKHVPVLAADDRELIMSRLQLVLAARAVLGKTLDLLGISKPEVM
jgi:arginyl-tRNA synthetase